MRLLLDLVSCHLWWIERTRRNLLPCIRIDCTRSIEVDQNPCCTVAVCRLDKVSAFDVPVDHFALHVQIVQVRSDLPQDTCRFRYVVSCHSIV